jgi:hypothetical protein
MSDCTPVVRRSRQSPRLAVRSAATGIMAAGLALLVAACGGGTSSIGSDGSPSAGASTTTPSAVGYSACMRSHGVPSFPDPDSSGHLPKGDAAQFGVSNTQLEAARGACQRMLPDTNGSFEQQTQDCIATGTCPQALVAQILTLQRGYARCMRSHGVPNFPDPTIDSEGRPVFEVSKAGLSAQYTHSSTFAAKDCDCERRLVDIRSQGSRLRTPGQRFDGRRSGAAGMRPSR